MTHIREAVIKDHAGIAALEQRHGLFTVPQADWQLRWQGNPAIEKGSKPWPVGWVIETPTDHGDTIVGFFGNIPMAYELNGKRLLVAATNSWVVDVAYRGQAMALLSRFMDQPTVDLFISTTANAATAQAMTALRARRVPQPDCDKALFWVTHPPSFCQALAVKKGLPLAPLLGAVSGLAAGLVTWFQSLTFARPPKTLKTTIIPKFDGRFDDLWQRLGKNTQNLQRLRNQESLDWHFRRHLNNNQAWIIICERTPDSADPALTELAGYAVCVRQDNPEIGLSRAVLADFQAENMDPQVLALMLRAGISECKRRKISCLEAIGYGSGKRRIMKTLKPWTRLLPNWPYMYKARDKTLREQLSRDDCWDVCSIDGDACL